MNDLSEQIYQSSENIARRYAKLIHELPAEATRRQATPFETVIVDAETGGMKAQKLAQFSQIPAEVLLELAEHHGKGVAKYPDSEAGEPNWQRGYSWRLSVDACMRHFLAFLTGEDIDPDTGSSHLVAAVWHLMTLRWFQLNDKGKDFR